MGLTDQFVAAPSEALARRQEIEPLGVQGSWQFGRLWSSSDVRAAVVDLVRALGVPVIGAFIFDSDFGGIYAGNLDSEVVALAVREPYAAPRDDPGALWAEHASGREAVVRLMEWASIFAPQTPTEEELKTALASGDVFAEESVAEIFRLLGLGDIARLVFAPPVDSEPDDVEIVRLDTGTHEHWGIHCNLALEPRRGSRPLAIIYWMPLDDDARREVIHRASEEFRRRGIRGERSTFGALDEATLFQRMDAIRAEFAERHRR